MMHVARLLALWCIEESRIGIIGVMIIVLDWCSVLPSLLHLVILLNYFLCLCYKSSSPRTAHMYTYLGGKDREHTWITCGECMVISRELPCDTALYCTHFWFNIKSHSLFNCTCSNIGCNVLNQGNLVHQISIIFRYWSRLLSHYTPLSSNHMQPLKLLSNVKIFTLQPWVCTVLVI